MSLAANKQVALTFVGKIAALDVEGALELTAPDMIWWEAVLGEFDNATYRRIARVIWSHYRSAPLFKVTGITAEDDRVALEVEAQGVLDNGAIYHNHYHLLLIVTGGRIKRLHEYHNSKHTAEVFAHLDPAEYAAVFDKAT